MTKNIFDKLNKCTLDNIKKEKFNANDFESYEDDENPVMKN